MSEAVGMMNDAYFVGRGELISWLNNLLGLNYAKVEETATGAAHCQIMDAIYSGQVPLHKVNFNAKFEYEFVANYKVLQTVFDKFKVDRHIPVDKLIRAKYQDNLEFLQWMKAYYDTHATGQAYDALERRKSAATKSGKPLKPAAPAVTQPAAQPVVVEQPVTRSRPVAPAKPVQSAPAGKPSKIGELQKQLLQCKETMDGLEKERDFYFIKLREVEVACQQAAPDTPLTDFIKTVEKILYAVEGDTDASQPQES